MEMLQIYFTEIARLFGFKFDDYFFDYLKSISKPNTTKCGREIMKDEGGWKCEDCELDAYSIYCNDCFIKEKHKNHKIYYIPSGGGFCDCGDNSVIKPEGFCHKHKGDYENINDLKNYIKSSIPEKQLISINNILNKIFLLFIDKIKDLSDSADENDEIYIMFNCLEIFCDKLFMSNLSLFYFITLKFTENFPYETNHKCFYYDENKKLITFIEEDKNTKHICICPFMQVIIYTLMRRKTKQNSIKFFNLFLQTYKNKIITSLCYLNCFTELFNNTNLESFIKIGYQVINEIGVLVYQEQNIPFLKSCFVDIYSICENFINNKEYEKLDSIYFKIFEIITHLPSITIFDKINSNHEILKIIINICCLSNNLNTFENKSKLNILSVKGFSSNLLEVEIYSIFSFLGLTNLLNYDNKETISFLFKTLYEKILDNKKHKEKLPNKTFSPHLTTIKCYSIFLNKFCFNYSIKNQCDLLDSFNYFQELFPKSKELNIFLFEELINYFGFIISQIYSFFAYYSYELMDYLLNYFSNSFIFYKIDITLMKYLLTQPEIKEKFNLKNILSLSDIDYSNQTLLKILYENLDINKDKLNNIEEKSFKYINSVIEYLYLIIRDNLSLENIAFRNVEFKFKIKDEIYEKLYQEEKEKIQSLIKNDIIHFILSNKNLVTRDDCINYLQKIYNNKYIELVDEILKRDCEIIYLTSGLMQFSLRRDILNVCDIDNIIPFNSRKNAIEYITNFQGNENILFNINTIESLNIQKKLSIKIYETFYNEKNISELIKLYNLINKQKEKYPSFKNSFYFIITKILLFAHKLCNTNLLSIDFKKMLIEKLDEIEDKEFIKYFDKEKVLDNNGKKETKNLKEKLKKKYIKKNEIINEQILSSNMIIEEIENKLIGDECVYCRQGLNKQQNNLECFGKICYYFGDYLTDIFKKKPENKRKKNRKFVSCNHKMHYKCFKEFICLNLKTEKLEYECPLCKKLSNIILCDFSSLIKSNYDLIKGIDYKEGKINLKEFFKDINDNKFMELFDFNILFFESYVSKLFHKQILIKDIKIDKDIVKEILQLINEDFEEFTIYYSLTNNKQEQINIWKNILYNIRLLYKYKILNVTEEAFNIDNFNNIEDHLIDTPVSTFINNFIINCIILLEPNESNKSQIKILFKNKILLYLFYAAFVKSNSLHFEDFITNNETELEKLLDLYKLKYKIILLLFDEKEENINLNISLEEEISFIKSNSSLINLINSIKTKNNNLSIQIKEQYLDIPKINIVNLPESGIEFFQRTNINCLYCHQQSLSSYFCLLCGNKMCYTTKCIVENISKEKNEYSSIYHSKICCGGNGLFLDVKSSEIIFILKRRIIGSEIFVYLNNFGEPLNIKQLNEDYKLNKEKLEKGFLMYIDMTFRKNNQKIYYGYY